MRVQKGASSCVLICLCERLFLCVFFKCVSMPGGRPFCPAMAKPDNWGVTAGDKMLEQKIWSFWNKSSLKLDNPLMSAIVRTLSSLLRKHYSWPSWPRESLRGYVVHNVHALQKQGKLSQSFGYTWLYVNLSEKQSHRNTIRNHTFVEGWEKNARTATQLRPPCCVAQVKTTCLFTIFLLQSLLPLLSYILFD